MNIDVKPFFVKYDYGQRKSTVENFETLKTNNEGYVKIKPRENNTTLLVEFKNGKDSLSTKNYNNQFGDGLYFDRNSEQKQWETQTVLFTDRAIYRPGQTVHFKGIVYKTDFEKKHEISYRFLNHGDTL